MQTSGCRALALALVVMVVPALAGAKATQEKTNQKDFAWAATFFVPCALDGVGENVSADGVIHFTTHTVIDGSGNWHSRWQGNPQGLTGIGETSGELYHFTGKTSRVEKGTDLPFTASFVNSKARAVLLLPRKRIPKLPSTR